MLDGPIVDVALGLIFFYVLLSLVCSSIQELVATWLGRRSKNLETGLINLLGKRYAGALYDHPLIKHLAKPGKLPSYIRPDILMTAVIEVVSEGWEEPPTKMGAPEIRQAVAQRGHKNDPLGEVLPSLAGDLKDGVNELPAQLENWLDEGMSRVSGWYKREVKVVLLVIAAVVTVAVNADSIRIVEELWRNDALRNVIAAEAQAAAADRSAEAVGAAQRIEELEDQLAVFPISYPNGICEFYGSLTLQQVPELLIGWLLTIAAVSLGAPFWFDLLSKVSKLRGAGGRPPRPQEEPSQ